MFVDQVLQNQLASSQNIAQATRSEIKTKQSPTNNLEIPEIAISLTPIGLVFSWVIFFIILRKIRTILEDKMVGTVKSSHQLPCKKCKFYSNNHYLKCAVNPGIVMTEDAKDCSEYSLEKDHKFSAKNLFH
ncbi:hypothetical protein H6G36_24775 [Anabaena minutissima FACHB-250]|nr:hypothetical protein [Anabaena minutissima FACHB-250]